MPNGMRIYAKFNHFQLMLYNEATLTGISRKYWKMLYMPLLLYSVSLLTTKSYKERAMKWTRPIQDGPKKRGHRLMTIIPSNLNRFINFFHWRFLSKLAVKCILKILPHLAYVATLPCETLLLAKQAINDKLQGSVAAYLRFGGVVHNQIKKA